MNTYKDSMCVCVCAYFIVIGSLFVSSLLYSYWWLL